MEPSGKQITIKEGSTVLIRGAADVNINKTDRADVLVSSAEIDDIQVEQEGDLLRVICRDDLQVMVPENVSIRLEKAGGDAFVDGVTGGVDVQKVGGDLAVRNCGRVDVGLVGGDMTARGIHGPLAVQKVGGDLSAEAAGPLSVDVVGGDLNLKFFGAGVHVRAGGDLNVAMASPAGDEVVLKAGGDIYLHVPLDMDARLDLSSGASDIRIDVKDQKQSIEQEDYVFTMGKGARAVRARAGGDIVVNDEPFEMESIEHDFRHMESHWSGWSSRHGPSVHFPDLDQRIRRQTERATRRAEERVKAAMERVERQSRFREQAFGKLGSLINFAAQTRSPEPPVPPSPPMPGEMEESSQVTNDERMLVLKMLQEHKITVDEAENLLAALEGQFD